MSIETVIVYVQSVAYLNNAVKFKK